MRIFLFVLVAVSLISPAVVRQAAAAPNADAVACDSLDGSTRIAGCSRLINSGRLPKQLAWVGYYQRGQGYSMLGRYDDAIADFNKSIASKPSSAVYSARGNAYREKGDLAQAQRDYDKAIELDPKNNEPYHNKGFVYSLVDDHDSAIRYYDKALAIKKLAITLNARGLAWRGKGNFERALADFDEAITLDPKLADTYINLGNLYGDRGEFDRGLAYCDQAIRLKPDSERPYNNRAILLSRKGDIDAALADLEKAIALNPKNGNTFITRGEIRSLKGDYDLAIADFDTGLRLVPENFTGYMNRGVAWQKKGNFDKALADFNRSAEGEPDNPSGYGARAAVFVAQGKYDQAFADFDKAIKLDPMRAAVFADRGEAHEKLGDIGKATEDFKTAIGLPRVHFLRTRGLISVSEDYKREQDTAKARLAVLEGAATVAPPSAPAVAPGAAKKADTPDPGRRIALVIGNGAYKNAPALPNPPNDARGVAKNLRDIGFEVSEGIDLDKTKLRDTIVAFLRDAAAANLALVFYAGHGMQIDGKNYLVPVDAGFDGSTDFATAMTDMDTILAALDGKLRTNIIVLDACRDNPMAKPAAVAAAEPSRSVKVRSGLAAPSSVGGGAMAGAGTMIAFATAPGQVALDGDGSNSPFSTAFIRHVGTPGLEVQQMMTRVRADVVASTKGKQVPWSNSALIGEVYLTR